MPVKHTCARVFGDSLIPAQPNVPTHQGREIVDDALLTDEALKRCTHAVQVVAEHEPAIREVIGLALARAYHLDRLDQRLQLCALEESALRHEPPLLKCLNV